MVHDVETDDRWLVLCNKWLAVDMSDGLIDKIFPVATTEQLKKFRNLFSNRTIRGLTDGHLWFSVFSRPARSHFTRLQRLSCCLALLMTTMLTSIMFYGIPDDPADQVMDFGTFRVSVREIIIGIESSLIVFPINLMIVQIFRMAQAHKVYHDEKFQRQRRKSKFGSEKSSTTSTISSARYTTSTNTNLSRVSCSSSTAASEDLFFNAKGDNTAAAQLTDIKIDQVATRDEIKKAPSLRENVGNGNIANSSPSTGGKFSTCSSFENGISAPGTAKSISTCDSTLSYFGGRTSQQCLIQDEKKAGDSTSQENEHVSFVKMKEECQDVSSLSSASSTTRSGGCSNECTSTTQSIDEGSFVELSMSPSSTSSEEALLRCKAAAGPRTHNEILLGKLEEIVIDLENTSPAKFSSVKEYNKAKEEAKGLLLTAKSIRTPSLSSNDSNTSSKVSQESIAKRRYSLPHWFVYVGWLILILTVGLSSYYIMLYGLKYGKQRSIDWLVSIFVSTFQSIFITQPLKVFFVAAFVAMILKKWDEDEDGSEEVEEIDIGTLTFIFSCSTKRHMNAHLQFLLAKHHELFDEEIQIVMYSHCTM